jgi:hypothetical protein
MTTGLLFRLHQGKEICADIGCADFRCADDIIKPNLAVNRRRPDLLMRFSLIKNQNLHI